MRMLLSRMRRKEPAGNRGKTCCFYSCSPLLRRGIYLSNRYSTMSVHYFGRGSAPKLAWTSIHFPFCFTYTRVDFARLGSVFPSLSLVKPTEL